MAADGTVGATEVGETITDVMRFEIHHFNHGCTRIPHKMSLSIMEEDLRTDDII